MRTALMLAIAALIAIPFASQAQQETPLSCVKDVTFSPAFLAKFPRAGAACNEVTSVHGQKWVRFNAEVKNVESNHITVDFTDKYKNPVSTMVFSFDPLATLTTRDGNQIAAGKAEKGEQIVVWMPEDRLGFYADPSAIKSEHFALVSESTPTER